MTSQSEHDLLKQIPSPSARLGVGLVVTLSVFLIFAVYTIQKIRWLEDFQVNVVEQNRKASLQLLRLQNDAYLLALTLRDMTLTGARYPIRERRAELLRLREDMSDALHLESQVAVNTPATSEKRAQLRATLQEFWAAVDRVFQLAEGGDERAARDRIQAEIEGRRAVISEIVARLLVLNDQAQAEAGEKIDAVYDMVKKDILVLIGVLFLVALGTGFYTLQANRKTFQRLHHLAEKLQAQSEHLRKISWKLIEVQEDTLRRVARDLHDEFGQILTAIGLMLTRAGQRGLDKDSAFAQEVEKVKGIVEETLGNVRDTSQMFRPAILDDFGLEKTLEWFIEQFSRQTGIQVQFEHELADGFFPSEDAIHVYRIVQEALNNVARHARAKEARVRLKGTERHLVLEIRDRGVGFRSDGEGEFIAGDGMGLTGMRERAEHLNGSLSVQSAPGEGTVIAIRLPLRKRAARLAPEEVT